MKNEIWKTIKGFKNYEVSSLGRVRNVKMMSQALSVDGYVKVCLTRNLHGKRSRKSFNVARLVAAAFISNQAKLPVVNHKDGNRINNIIGNLEWSTIRDNIIDAYRRKGPTKKALKIKKIMKKYGVSYPVAYSRLKGWKNMKIKVEV